MESDWSANVIGGKRDKSIWDLGEALTPLINISPFSYELQHQDSNKIIL